MGSTNGSENSTNMNVKRRGGKRLSQLFLFHSTTLAIILIYYACSIGLTFYQKQLFKEFKFPLITVIVHLCVKFVLAGMCRSIYTCYTGIQRVCLDWQSNWKRICPPGIAAGLDIGFSQWSLEFVTVTLYTMTKSTALLFILFFAILFKLEELNCKVVLIVVCISGGLLMFTYKYTEFTIFGFGLVLSASALSGLRWTLCQLVMHKGELGLSNPIDMVYHIQPWMTVCLVPLALYMEGGPFINSKYGFEATSSSELCWMWFRIVIGALLAFFMEVSEYLVVCFTSSLTLSIAGVAKEIMTLSLAIHFYNEKLSLINQLGLMCCVFGICLHVALKASNQARETKHISVTPQVSNNTAKVPLLNESGDPTIE